MKWGDTQNLISVITGLNLAYYAFREMRAPHLTRFEREVDQLQRDVYETMSDLHKVDDWAHARGVKSPIPNIGQLHGRLMAVWSEAMKLNTDVSSFVYGTTTQRFENKLGFHALLVGATGVLFLIVSALKYDDRIYWYAFWPIALAGLAPIVAVVGLNYLLQLSLKNRFESRYHKLWTEYHLDIKNEIDPLIVAEAKFNVERAHRPSPSSPPL